MTIAVDEFLRFESPHQLGAGLSLARLEGRIAIGRFLQRFPDYRLPTTDYRLTQIPTRGGRARLKGFLRAPFAAA